LLVQLQSCYHKY